MSAIAPIIDPIGNENPVQVGKLTLIKCLSKSELVKTESQFITDDENQVDLTDHLTDVRLASRFIKSTEHQLRYWHEGGKWMDYDGKHWEIDTPGGAHKYIKPFLAGLLNEAFDLPKGSEKKAIIDAILKREYHSGEVNMLKAAAVQPTSCIATSQLDHNQQLLNCLNGTVDLVTGELLPHNYGDYITKLTHIEYDPDAKCPMFDQFLTHIMGGDLELISYMQRWSGYSLTGSTAEQIVQIWFGTGANGKSVLSNIQGALLGDYTKVAGGCLLIQKPSGGTDLTTLSELAKLRGVRLARISEIDEGSRLAEAQLKNITGGDTITCRTLYGKPFEYEPTFKIILLCNHMPQVRGTDKGIWRRIHKVPFTVTIPPEEQDQHLLDKLKTELPGILNWAIAGCLEWQKNGLMPPQAVLTATEEYKCSEDMFSSWLNDCCNLGYQYSTKASILLESFVKYSGWKGMSQKKFGSMLKDHNFTKSTSNGVVWNGLEPLEPLNPFSEKSYEKPSHGMFPEFASNGSKGSIDMEALNSEM